jgi:hypothetical protein
MNPSLQASPHATPRPALLKRLRKRAGKIKSMVLDRWPYAAAMAKVPRMRAELRATVDALPPIHAAATSRYELHMLCGHRDIDMGILSSWSLMRFLDGEGRLIVHSDGSLNAEDEQRWRAVVGRLDVVSREESDRAVAAAIGDTRELHAWRTSNWASAQLVDAHLFGDAPTLLILDSDVLVFEKPEAVLAALDQRPPRFAWCEDLRNAYSGEIATIREITGVTIPPKLCAGFLVSPRMTKSDFQRLDDQMVRIREDRRLEVGHFWSCQTYYALLAAAFEGSAVLPDAYRNTNGKTAAGQVLRHYVGIPSVRFRYFTEGTRMLLGPAS